MNRRLAPAMFAITAIAYMVAVTQRSSLGVAGVLASERFEVGAAALSTLAVAQLAVYAALQIPVGMLLDRFGPSRLILVGALLMSGGQLIVALAPELGVAVMGRMLVGAGDATTFVSGLRIIAAWFPPRRVPVYVQWYGNLGQLGQVLSAVPFGFLLRSTSWTPAFLSVASLALITSVAVAVFLRDSPELRRAGEAISIRGVMGKVAQAARRPGTRLGFWAHFTTQFPGTVFGLLWGFPLMTQGMGLEPALASSLLPVIVLAGMVLGPFLGVLTGRYPLRRSNLVLICALLILGVWVAMLLWPGLPPLWLLVVLLVVMGIGGSGSAIGFDYARTFNPASSLGSASGIVNVGGFVASFTTMFLIGISLDGLGIGVAGAVDWQQYKLAFWVIPGIMLIGLSGLLLSRRRTRGRMARDEGIIIDPLWVAIGRRWFGSGRRGM
ncbi:MFS transporter [Pseudoclavibacter sp. RFBJ3]|uniref:MFS transporter n=1 Tax=unclassified Pseudoclavibacter TaxID=2615177 RepID=UPI000CE7F969|nr:MULTISPECIES: MFS transporter [unclassified Pseudoclavibacter]PPF84966.1 MFS transporter [Pseudoclavibacter sp. RFBJ5]PPF93970.1 MFS transporter [Pseudoclavibacter sp. RFBJ3]PPF98687.1 MFS transporter [Pseudoclavibacter sp. RFBH5]PPG24352.1 MFS transporter [Pseudoclavibacter sp. RFBI4]